MKITTYAALAALACGLAAGPLAQAQAPTTPAAKPAAKAAKPADNPRVYGSPEEAAKALAEAVRAKNVDAFLTVVGPGSVEWLSSGDAVADANDWKTFLAAYDEKNAFEKAGDAKTILTVGRDDWPFPAPIVKRGSGWAFDSAAGREEIVNRRVGRNELDTIQTMLAMVDAQREYAATDADGNGYADYARRFRSSPGKKDGLYWATPANDPPSPLGMLVAVAAQEGYGKTKPPPTERVPYHGYYYRILTAQGKNAPGGAYEYLVGDKLLGGFAIVAWPARYGVSGAMSFIVNHDGEVYEKDLGPQTASIAAAMSRYDPDKTWRKAR